MTQSQTVLSSGAMSLASEGSLMSGSLFSSGGGFSVMDALSTGLTLASVAQSLSGGRQQGGAIAMDTLAQADALSFEAEEDLLEARDEEIAGEREANNILERINRSLASQQLAFSANGIDVSFGTPQNVAANTQKIGEAQASTTRQDARVRAFSRRRQANERLISRGNILQSGAAQSSAAVQSGVTSAINTAAESVFRRVNRG